MHWLSALAALAILAALRQAQDKLCVRFETDWIYIPTGAKGMRTPDPKRCDHNL